MSAELLRAFQLADSSFPSGAFAYSWGLEKAAEDGMVTRSTFDDWLACEMLGRWAQFDRVFLADTFRADDPLAVDAEADLWFMAEELRTRSAEAGQAFLASMARLTDPVAIRFRDAALQGRATGHLPVAQGAVFKSQGLDLKLALATSAHIAVQGMASAGVRLGLIGALEVQRILQGLQSELVEAIAPPTPGTLPASFAPISEIAMLRPSELRLFAN